MKKTLIALSVCALVVLCAAYVARRTTVPVACTTEAKLCPDGSAVGRTGPTCEFAPCPTPSAIDIRNGTYDGGETPFTLVHGAYNHQGPAGASDVTTIRVFGNEANGDLDGDGKPDVAFLLTENTGGSGTFYSVAVVLASEGTVHHTGFFALGDRIAPQTTEIHNGIITVNYADHAPGQSFAEPPSLGVSVRLTVQDGKLVPVK